ncbi:PH domain-containing protein [Actinoplanes lobatus]|uniref:PH domain-containing protein n=1 Tax=Actinoplanes lobatus TaxID=113568 RepID=UPI00165EC636|nr:PH domain-containing protein [Actinoplanes lobatus]
MGDVSSRPVLRVRKSGAVLVAALIALVGTVPLAGSAWQLTPILLIPLAALVWAWRAGTDVYPDELRVRALFGGSRVPWSRVDELAPDEHGRVSALLDNGNVIRLTGVTSKNLPLVLEAGGHPVTDRDAAGQ